MYFLSQKKISLLSSSIHPRIQNWIKIFLGSLFIGLCAQVSIPLWFTPVPLTGQNFAVILVGVTLGSRNGMRSVALYLAHGALGVPVWAGGAFGPAVLLGPTGGYLWAYLLQAYFIGKVCEQPSMKVGLKTFLIFLSISIGQLLIGSIWLSFFIPIKDCLKCGTYPFIPGETLKIALIFPYLKWMKSKQGEKI